MLFLQRWHPDKCTIEESTKAKIKFQEIQEAYAGLYKNENICA
jgi:curved DNA-binding protein CbpA